MTDQWYADGYIVAIPFILIFAPAYSWVMIYRPIWANKIWGSFYNGGLTPARARREGIVTLIGSAVALMFLAYRLLFR
jgi:hypothetical protein